LARPIRARSRHMRCSKNRIIPLFERDVMAVEKLPERAAAAGIRWANPLRKSS
jgi:hypothetical protein